MGEFKMINVKLTNSTREATIFGIIIISGLMLRCNSSSKNDDQVAKVKNPNGGNNSWGYMGYGGGGATFYPAVSPHNSKVAFLSCDMTGSFTTNNGGYSWRMFNLRGVVRNYVFDPLDSNVIYALVSNHSNGLYKSADAGTTWSLLYPHPDKVLGIVAKGDHAEEVIVTTDSTLQKILALAVDPENSLRLYAAIQIEEVTGFYISDDGGINWSMKRELKDGASNIFVLPGTLKENGTIYITGKSTTTVRRNGQWAINKGPEGVESLTEFAGGYDYQKRVFVIYATAGKSYFNAKGDPSGIYFSDNGGATWNNRQAGIVSMTAKNTDLPEWRSVATSARHPEVVYISYANLKVHADTTCVGVAKSIDYGMTWSLVWKDKLVKGGDQHATNLDGGWINERYGPTWGENPFSIGVSADNPNVCYTTDFGRVIKTEDGGRTWEQVYTRKKEGGGWISRGIEVNCSYNVVFDPLSKSHMFITNTDVGLMESTDGGESWMSNTVNAGIPKEWINSTYWLTFDPEVKNKAWAVMSGIHDLPRPKMWKRNKVSEFNGGIVETLDAGRTWKPISASIGEAAMTHILIDPTSDKTSRTIYACAFGKGVYKSVDGGKTWQQKNKGIASAEPFAWRITRRESDGVLFLVVSRRSDDGGIGSDLDGALYRSEDGAENWKRISLPIETNAPTSVVVDPDHQGRLLMSAWGRETAGKFSADIGGGIFLSDDDGKSWAPLLTDDQHIHDITYDPRIKTFYACGFTGSAYKSNDLKTWHRIKGYNFKWGRRVELDPRDREKIFILTFGGGVWYGPAMGDEHALEDIATPKSIVNHTPRLLVK
jgi:BNR/Asp-box repeat